MKAMMKVEKPDDIEFTLTVTMRLGDWVALQKQLEDGWPACDLSMRITDMRYQATKHFYPKEKLDGK